MTNHPRVGPITKRIAWLIGALLPVAVLTASAVPWKSGFALIYLAVAFGLHTLVRLKDPAIERFAHIFVLSGSAPILVGQFYGRDLGAIGVVHVVAVLTISIGLGYLLGDRARPQTQRHGTT
jgi:hypothetical protein